MENFKSQLFFYWKLLVDLIEGLKTKIYWLVFAISIVSFLDLIAIFMISYSTKYLFELQTGNSFIEKLITENGLLGTLSTKQFLIIILSAGVLMFIFKTFLSVFLSTKILNLFSFSTAKLSFLIIEMLGREPFPVRETRSRNDTTFSLTRGVEMISMNILAPFFLTLPDLFLICTLVIALLFVNTTLTLFTVVLIIFFTFMLSRFMNIRAQKYGAIYTRLNMESLKIADETQVFSKEIHVTDSHEVFEAEFKKSRDQLSKILSKIHFLPYVSKYAMEAVSIMLLSGVALLQLSTIQNGNFYQSIIFLAALTRITPALMRIQQSVLSVRSHIGLAEETGRILLEAKMTNLESEFHEVENSNPDVDSDIKIINVSYAYPNSEKYAVNNINLTIPKGSISAIVGPSGSGKTTLVNLLLGLIRPTDGQVRIMGDDPDIAIMNTPGIIGYVPQVTILRNDTVRANVNMKFEKGDSTDPEIFIALNKANLRVVIDKMPGGLDTKLGTDGIQLSGGELQRLGIARALYCRPKILVLDEATSSLDGDSEKLISELLLELSKETTIIFVAHRLSSLRIADQVILMEAGAVSDCGTLEKVLQRNMRFQALAASMGLEIN